MPNTTLHRAVAAAAAVVAVFGLAIAGPAAADTQKHQDPRGDVQKIDVSRAAKPGIDVVHLENTFEGKHLTLAMTTANLQRKGYGAEWFITAGDNTYVLLFDHTERKPEVQFAQTGSPRLQPHLRGDLTCQGVKASAHGDTVTATIPRFCIDGASEVRVAGIMVAQEGALVRIDDSRQKGLGSGGDIRFGPRLRRN